MKPLICALLITAAANTSAAVNPDAVNASMVRDISHQVVTTYRTGWAPAVADLLSSCWKIVETEHSADQALICVIYELAATNWESSRAIAERRGTYAAFTPAAIQQRMQTMDAAGIAESEKKSIRELSVKYMDDIIGVQIVRSGQSR